MVLATIAVWPIGAQAASFCNPDPSATETTWICSGTANRLLSDNLTEDTTYIFQGVTLTDEGVLLSTANSDDSNLTLIFDPTVDGGPITHKTPSTASSFDGVGMFSDGGDLTLTALMPPPGTSLHNIDAEDNGITMRTELDGAINVNSYLPVTAGAEGYHLSTETGEIVATIAGPVFAGRDAVLADTKGGDVTINVVHAAPDSAPDILFDNGHPTIEGLVGGVVVRDSGGSDPNKITVNIEDNVSIVGAYDETDTRDYVHAGVHAVSETAAIGVMLADNVFIDPVDFGLYSLSATAGVLTKIGSGNEILVNDLDADGLAVGLFAQSGAADDSTPYDPTYPHAVAVVTGGANEIKVVGDGLGASSKIPVQVVAGIAAVVDPVEVVGKVVPDDPLKSSILVSLGTQDAGGGSMAGDRITVVGDGLAIAKAGPTIFGIAAINRGEGPDTGPAITIRSDDASAGMPTRIFVGDCTGEEDCTEDATGDGSAGIYARNMNSAETVVDLGAYTDIIVVDTDSDISHPTSQGIYVVAGSVADPAGGDISIGIGEHNHIDVTGGFGITAAYENAADDAEAVVTVAPNALVRSDYSAVAIGRSYLNFLARPDQARLHNMGSLVSATELIDPSQTGAVMPIVDLQARSSVNFINYSGGYVGNAFDPTLADPSALALFADVATGNGGDDPGEIVLGNYGSMVGRAVFSGTSGVDATINNIGYWNFVGDTVIDAGGVKSINNGGVIHTVDIAGGPSEAIFVQTDTENINFNNFAWDTGSATYVPGLISMLDGEANDRTSIVWHYDGGDFAAGYNGSVAVDAFLDVDGIGASDQLELRLSSTGSTAVHVENVNPGFGGWNDVGIQVMRKDTAVAGCDPYCRPGDFAYLSSTSPDFALIDDGAGGLGVIRDGLNAWMLRANPNAPSRVILVSTDYGPDRWLMPSLITTVQNLWYDTDSVVQDQLAMLDASNGAGGGGADLAAAYDFLDVGAATAPRNGIWLRASGNWTKQDSSVTEGIFTYDTSFDQDTYSVLAGADMKLDPDSPFRFGLFGGYVTSHVNFGGYDIDTDYEGGTFGAYAAYVAGGFSADATFKADLVEAAYDSTAGDVKADVVNIGVRANTGYRFDGGMGFVEPLASFAYVDSRIDDMNFGDTSVDFSNGQSLRAGIGARFGTAFGGPAGTTTELSLLGKLWNEFEDKNTVTITGPGGTDTYTDGISGLFGEVTATAAMTAADGLTSGFLSAGAEFNDDFTSYSAKAGVRRAW